MGSLSANGIPVVNKQSLTFRKHDINIEATNNVGDSVSGVTSHRPSLSRAIGSGSIVRDDGTVNYHEELVFGATRMGRTSLTRIPSDTGNPRTSVVDLGDNRTDAVIETSLSPDTPQLAHRHTGNRVVEGQAVGDTVVERLADSGVYDTGFPL